MKVFPLGDAAMVIEFAEQSSSELRRRIQACSQAVQASSMSAILSAVPAYTTLTVHFDPIQGSYETVKAEILSKLAQCEAPAEQKARTVEIPVCYAEPFALDLRSVAEAVGLTPQEVVSLHSCAVYEVAMIGFVPAFPYLVGLPAPLRLARRATPRRAVPAGSVAIAGEQTGIYPLETPGGWHIIGRTPLKLFQPQVSPPSLLRSGDRVQFYPISEREFFLLAETAQK